MKIPNFKSEEGSIMYKNTVGELISPRVANVLLKRVQAELSPLTKKAVLDLGCGPGNVCLPLAKGFPNLQIIAVDSSESMIHLAQSEAIRQHVPNLQFERMDAGHIALPLNSFDFVLCNLAFPFFGKPVDSMREVFAVVRPGGSVFFTVPGTNTWREFFDIAKTALGDMVSMARPFLAKFSQSEGLLEAMSAAGFHDIVPQRTLLPFHFANGQAVLEFFGQLFHLLEYATADMKTELADAIDDMNPDGFTMHYEAMLLSGQKPDEP